MELLTWILAFMCAMALVIMAPAFACGQEGFQDDRPLCINSIGWEPRSVPRYECLEIRLDVQGTYNNAFDPEEIDIAAHFHGPDGKECKVPGFLYRPYRRELKGAQEILIPEGEPEWRIRFAPTETGIYRFFITARDRTGAMAKSKEFSFEAIPSPNPGYVRVSTKDRRYFAFDNGIPYVPIGANICWAGPRGTFDYDDWLSAYAGAGCNYFRVWLGPAWATLALERAAVGKIDLASAWRLDYVLDLAERLGLYVMLCLDSYNELRLGRDGSYPFWEQTPHNVANGGPLQEPGDFWTNPEMLRLYRNKLRYLVARYGYRTHVLSWEFWNEVDIISPVAYRGGEVKNWHEEMAEFLRSIDPWKHLITTSFSRPEGKPEIDLLAGIDYVQTHRYGNGDPESALVRLIQRKEAYGKPHYVGEFGLDVSGRDAVVDPQGLAIHDAIWSSLLSGAAGGAMSWWWDNHIHPHDLYFHFRALAGFIEGIDFPGEEFRRIEDARFTCGDLKGGIRLRYFGIRGRNTTLIWVQNKPSGGIQREGAPEPIPAHSPCEMALTGWQNGTYKIILWDTFEGKAIEEKIESVHDKVLRVRLPEITRDIAVKAMRQNACLF
ncbi:MAG: DUF5060 domain-containing protein [Firmicutes bacterium]|nr:DUF5060 domain-containing protein [Bacillota bacterium]